MIAGGGGEAGVAQMKFNGKTYPDNPTAPPAKLIKVAMPERFSFRILPRGNRFRAGGRMPWRSFVIRGNRCADFEVISASLDISTEQVNDDERANRWNSA